MSTGPAVDVSVTDRASLALRLVSARISFYAAKEKLRREEKALLEIPFWRLLKLAAQRRRVLDARTDVLVTRNAMHEAELARDAERGAA